MIRVVKEGLVNKVYYLIWGHRKRPVFDLVQPNPLFLYSNSQEELEKAKIVLERELGVGLEVRDSSFGRSYDNILSPTCVPETLNQVHYKIKFPYSFPNSPQTAKEVEEILLREGYYLVGPIRQEGKAIIAVVR